MCLGIEQGVVTGGRGGGNRALQIIDSKSIARHSIWHLTCVCMYVCIFVCTRIKSRFSYSVLLCLCVCVCVHVRAR